MAQRPDFWGKWDKCTGKHGVQCPLSCYSSIRSHRSPPLAPLPADGLVSCSRWARPTHPGGRSGWTGGRSWCCSWHWCCFGAGKRLGTSCWGYCCSCCCWGRCSPVCGVCSYSSPESHFHPPRCPWTERLETEPMLAAVRKSPWGSCPCLSFAVGRYSCPILSTVR